MQVPSPMLALKSSQLKSSIFINFTELSSFQPSAFELKLLCKTESLTCCILHLLGHKKVSYGHIVMVSGPQVEGTARLSLSRSVSERSLSLS